MMTEEEAFNKLAAMCSTSEYCRFDMQEKLYKWGIPLDKMKCILDKLENERYIDEERFCRAYVKDKFRFSKWGKKKISYSLALKKISPINSAKFINEIDREEYIETLKNILESKRKSIRAKDKYELNGKLIRFAISRGFEVDDIKCCIADIECDY